MLPKQINFLWCIMLYIIYYFVVQYMPLLNIQNQFSLDLKVWWIWWKPIHFSTLPFVVWQTLLRAFKKGWRAKTCQYKRDSSLHYLEILLPFHIFDMGVFYSNRRHILFWLLDGDDGGSQSQQHTYDAKLYCIFVG